MPSLFRFITILAALAALGFGIVYTLATFVRPVPREMTETISLDRLNR